MKLTIAKNQLTTSDSHESYINGNDKDLGDGEKDSSVDDGNGHKDADVDDDGDNDDDFFAHISLLSPAVPACTSQP